jgi:nicotinate-nucleotide adenylyltransferase
VTQKSRIGLFGGTFDPVHLGHLLMAENALQQLNLQKVVFAPAGNPPHKSGQRLAATEDRIAMIRLAIDDRPGFVCSRMDSDHGGPAFTWQLLERIHGEMPGVEVVFLMGGDSLRDLSKWARPQRILELAQIAIVERPDYTISDQVLQAVPGLEERLRIIDAPMCEVSSTEIRERVASGRSIRYLVPDQVRRYIEDHKLYQPTSSVEMEHD